MNLEQILGLAVFIISVIAYGFGVVKYIIDKVDVKMTLERTERLASEERLRENLQTYVLKEDHHRATDDVKVQISTMTRDFNSRLDQLLNLVAQAIVSNKSNQG